MTAVSVLLLLAISAEQPAVQPVARSWGPGKAIPWPYPFAPFEDPDFAATAARFERRLTKASDVRGAVRAICEPTPPAPPAQRDDGKAESHYYDLKAIERRVAENFLIARADKAFPFLLDAIRRGDRNSSEAESNCRTKAFTLVRMGICFGYEAGGSSEDLDAQPLAVERRALSQRALASVLAAGGPRSAVALDLLAEDTGVCSGLPEAVRASTPTLVKLLGAPHPPVRIPLHPHDTASTAWDVAFRVLSFDGVDRAIAEQPVAAFLEHDASAPLAALAIARMGGDANGAVPRIARVIETIHVRPQAELTQLGDAVNALVAIGKPAHFALPSLAKLLSRPDMPGCHSLGGRRYTEMVRAIATPADADLAVAVLAPLVRCDRDRALASTERPVVELLGELGAPARGVLLSMFRDDTRLVSERLETLGLARNAGYVPGDADGRLAKALEHKRDNPPPKGPASVRLASALAACRAEAGLPPAPAGTAPLVPPVLDRSLNGFPGCLAMYLCGPRLETYARTMQRCCQDAYRQDLPSYCAAGTPAQ